MSTTIVDQRKVRIELEDIPNVPESQIERQEHDTEGRGFFKPELLEAKWTRVDDEEWKLEYLVISGMRYDDRTGKLANLRGRRVYTTSYEDLLSLIDAPWLPPLIKLIHPVVNY